MDLVEHLGALGPASRRQLLMATADEWAGEAAEKPLRSALIGLLSELDDAGVLSAARKLPPHPDTTVLRRALAGICVFGDETQMRDIGRHLVMAFCEQAIRENAEQAAMAVMVRLLPAPSLRAIQRLAGHLLPR